MGVRRGCALQRGGEVARNLHAEMRWLLHGGLVKTNSRRAVVIEDDENVRGIIMRLLRKMDFEAVGFAYAESALAWFDMHPAPELVTVDLALPGRSGLDVCRWLKNEPHTAKVPVVVVTASASTPHQAEAASLGAFWLQKPFDLASYRALVDHLVPPLPLSEQRAGVYFHKRG